MLRFVALSALIASASAHGSYAIGGPAISSYSTGIVHSAVAVPKVAVAAPIAAYGAAPMAAVGYSGYSGVVAPAVAAVAPVASVAAHAVVPGAVLSNHIVKHYDVPSAGAIVPTTIDVPANVLPVNFVFRSASSAINVQQAHQGSAGSFKETVSTDEPHVLKHTVTKPIISEVREIISPYRKILQQVEPVREEIQTLVARGVGATQGALLAANMARPAVMAAPLTAPIAAPVAAMAAPLAAPIAAPIATMAAPVVSSFAAAAPVVSGFAAGPAIAPVAAVARPALAVGYGAGLGYNTAWNSGLIDAKVAGFSAPAVATYAKKL